MKTLKAYRHYKNWNYKNNNYIANIYPISDIEESDFFFSQFEEVQTNGF